MMKNVLVLGFMGNMGKRYTTILNHIGVPWCGVDARDMGVVTYSNGIRKTTPRKFPGIDVDGILIATATDTHAFYINLYKRNGVPILCEKPITKDLFELRKLILDLKDLGTKFSMVNQYSYLVKEGEGPTIYNYFKHGADGLLWDCIQPIGLAGADVTIKNDSPVWTCYINGHKLLLSDMDLAYVKMISDWVTGKHRSDLDEILRMHEKVAAMEAEHNAARAS